MSDHPDMPDWPAAAAEAATALGLDAPLAGMPAPAWERVCARVAEDLASRCLTPPPGWRASLARAAGRPDPAELTPDEADAALAEQGEVFAPEDDA